MTKAELLAAARLVLDDAVETYLWSDTELTGYLQDAEQEATERADLLPVEGVATYCTVAVLSGTASYSLSPLIYKVNKAWLSGESYKLERTSRQEKDYTTDVWESDTGTPTELIFENSSIRLYPIPTANTTLYLTVNRLPVTPMGTSPEINARYHRRMLDWVYHLAYLKRDSDTYDPGKAMDYAADFERSFGPKIDMATLTRQQKRTATIMRDIYE